MSSIFMMSLRSVGQKHYLHNLADDLRRERDYLSGRDLADKSGALVSHLASIFVAHPTPAAVAADNN